MQKAVMSVHCSWSLRLKNPELSYYFLSVCLHFQFVFDSVSSLFVTLVSTCLVSQILSYIWIWCAVILSHINTHTLSLSLSLLLSVFKITHFFVCQPVSLFQNLTSILVSNWRIVLLLICILKTKIFESLKDASFSCHPNPLF